MSLRQESEKCPNCGEDITWVRAIEKTVEFEPSSMCPYCGYIIRK